MRRLIFSCLIVGLIVSLVFLPCVHATNEPTKPSQKVITWIDYIWDGAGKLIGQVMHSITTGFTNLGGQRYSYTITSKVTFDVINGEAYEKASSSVEERPTADGKKTIIETRINYLRDAVGRLMGANGRRRIRGWTEEADENNDGRITPGEGRKYYVEETTLEFKVINGQAEVVREITNRKMYDKEGGTLISETNSITERTYQIIKGITKLVRVRTTGRTYFYNDGTTDGKEVAADKSNLPYTEFTQITHYEYDAAGNILPMSGVERRQVGTDAQGNPIYKLYDAAGNEITDTNGDGSIVDEALKKMKGSYTVTYSSGVRKGSEGQWVVFTQTELTPFKVENGMALPLWTYTRYSNHNLKPDAPANVAQDPIVRGTVVAIHRVESTANNVGQKNTATWVIIRDDEGRLWTYRFFNSLSDIGDIKVGDRVEAQGDTMSGTANMVEATVKIKKLQSNN